MDDAHPLVALLILALMVLVAEGAINRERSLLAALLKNLGWDF